MIRERLFELFKENGIDISEDELNLELPMDSLQFISLIVSIEEAFSITIEDEYLKKDKIKSFLNLEEIILQHT